jgi:iron uptake system EfeUOB component EfeO/EfeM
MGRDAYIAEKTAELDPKIDALIAELKEQQKNKKGV